MLKDSKVFRVFKASKVFRAVLEQLVDKASKDFRVFKASKVFKDSKDL